MRKIIAVFVMFLVVGSVALLSACAPKQKAPSVIKFGSAMSLTGKYAREGKFYKDGYILWEKTVNKAGGIKVNGKAYKVKVIIYDDESNPAKSQKLYEKLVTSDKVNFLLGPYSSGITIPDSSIAERYKIPMIEGGGASGKIFSRGYKYIFGTLPAAGNYFKNTIEMLHMMAYTGKNSAKTIEVVHSDSAFDNAVAAGAARWVKAFGLKLTGVQEYPSGSNDLSSVLTKIKERNPDVVLVAGHTHDALLFIKQAKENKVNIKLMAFTVGVQAVDFRQSLGNDANYAVGVTPWLASMNFKGAVFGTASEFAKTFKAAYGYAPDYHAASAVAGALAFQSAITKANSLDPKKVRDALASLDLKTMYGEVKFQANGQIAKGQAVIQVQNGKAYAVFPKQIAQKGLLYPAPSWDKR
ncbi:MAG: amino acid ABC transporter substrate-binding protein [Epsilonproteobacteria bacterium]|nr:amino acid ABC transporter substrate-binding protein [Campylobacterota bacterium]